MIRIENEKSSSSAAPEKADAHVEAEANDWPTENAEFVAA